MADERLTRSGSFCWLISTNREKPAQKHSEAVSCSLSPRSRTL
ncbi:hypothetical protein BN903_107 [Halorubrum sp. AJ67]|nr:hypothetical protein BN903_107 [Halorubrum sp. AJ67]